MRKPILALSVLALLAPWSAHAAGFPCADLPKAEKFVHERLHPGPNTREAEKHLERARHARSDRECSDELAAVDAFARKSMAADKAAVTH
jgi:hypothetical protein